MRHIINKLINKNCDDDNIKCKSFNTISLVISIVAFIGFVAIYLRNVSVDINTNFFDVGRLFVISIISAFVYIIHKKGFATLAKHILIFTLLFFLIYYPLFINTYSTELEILAPIFILMIAVITQLTFYFTKEKYAYYFVMVVLFFSIIFYANIYDYYFPEIGITKRWGLEYFEIIIGFITVFFVINFIVYYILKKYKSTQRKLSLSYEEIKQNNIELEEKNEELKELKSELTAQNEELKVLDSTKDMFLSVISHDLKNSFNIVNGFSELLDIDYDSYDEAKRKYFIKEINSSSNLIYNLLENLLNWSNIKLNGISSNIETINIKEFIEESIITHNIIAKTKNISIIYQSKQLTEIKADKYAITTVVGNFINNAIKFSQENSKIEIFIELKNAEIQFTVKDYGVGLSTEAKNKLFDIGAHRSTKGTNQERGTGLGLILCSEIISKSEGKIWVESEEGKGSSFSFSINTY